MGGRLLASCRPSGMTYLRFHLLFNLPALVLLLWLARRKLLAAHWKGIATICGIVFVATTPWDNWAVYQRIWSFDWARVTPVTVPFRGVLWKLPAEEYAFFLIETVSVSLLTVLCLPNRRGDGDAGRNHTGGR